MVEVLGLVSLLCWSAVVADIGPNETQVFLAAIGAIASLVNGLLLGAARRERKHHEQAVRDAVGARGLVAMVPEQIVKDVESAAPHTRRAGDEAP